MFCPTLSLTKMKYSFLPPAWPEISTVKTPMMMLLISVKAFQKLQKYCCAKSGHCFSMGTKRSFFGNKKANFQLQKSTSGQIFHHYFIFLQKFENRKSVGSIRSYYLFNQTGKISIKQIALLSWAIGPQSKKCCIK